MTRKYCDCCEQEIVKDNSPDQEGVVSIQKGKTTANIGAILAFIGQSRSFHPSVNDFDICFTCRLDALKRLDKRPVAEVPRKG